MAGSDTSSQSTEGGRGPTLKRVMGPGLLLLFIIGDILGTGVYALTGQVAGEVGGAAWAPILCAFAVAMLTAFSYLELVTKYPRAAGAALYTHKAFGIHFLTFLVAFAVMSSGITSASTAARAFAANLGEAFGFEFDGGVAITLVALGFMLLLAAVNLRGVSESVKTNVVLTCVELSGLLIIIMIGLWAIGGGDGDLSRVTQFDIPEGRSIFGAITAGTALAFFSMVGFEDAVNMAEEAKNPSRIFPKVMLLGLSITVVIYVLVAVVSVAIVPLDQLSVGATPLLQVIEIAAPDFPIWIFAFITMFAVANTALINMMMASRLLYGMSRERVLPAALGRVHHQRRTPYISIAFTTVLALGLITFVGEVAELGGTTALLLLAVFAVVNVAVLVLRRRPVEHQHFTAPSVMPILGVITCAYLASPLVDRPVVQYQIAGVLLALGIVLWLFTVAMKRRRRGRGGFDEENLGTRGPIN